RTGSPVPHNNPMGEPRPEHDREPEPDPHEGDQERVMVQVQSSSSIRIGPHAPPTGPARSAWHPRSCPRRRSLRLSGHAVYSSSLIEDGLVGSGSPLEGSTGSFAKLD